MPDRPSPTPEARTRLIERLRGSVPNVESWMGREYSSLLIEAADALEALGDELDAARVLHREEQGRSADRLRAALGGERGEGDLGGEQSSPSVEAEHSQLEYALHLLARYEYLAYGATLKPTEDYDTHRVCPCCTWPEGGHKGPGRYKGNAENTHEQGCSLNEVLHGRPAPRLDKTLDRLPASATSASGAPQNANDRIRVNRTLGEAIGDPTPVPCPSCVRLESRLKALSDELWGSRYALEAERGKVAGLESQLVQARRDRDDFGPLFVRDACRVLGLNESEWSLDDLMARIEQGVAAESQLEAGRRKIEAYDAARAVVKTEGNTRAYYVLRAEAAESQLEEARETARLMSEKVDHMAQPFADAQGRVSELESQLEDARGWGEQQSEQADELAQMFGDTKERVSELEHGIKVAIAALANQGWMGSGEQDRRDYVAEPLRAALAGRVLGIPSKNQAEPDLGVRVEEQS